MKFQSLTLMQRSLRPWRQGRLHLFPQHAGFPGVATAVPSRAELKVGWRKILQNNLWKW